VDKAASAVRLSDFEYVPDLDVFALRLLEQRPVSGQEFGHVCVRLTYDLFDGGKRRATIRERQAQLAQAKGGISRASVTRSSCASVPAFDKLERTRQMIAVSEELVALRAESRRVVAEQ